MQNERSENMDDLDDMVKRIKSLKKEQGITNQDITDKTGMPLGTISKILCKQTKDPAITSILKIAHALGTTADHLVYGTESEAPVTELSQNESVLVNNYREMNESSQANMLQYSEFILSSEKNRKDNTDKQISIKQA